MAESRPDAARAESLRLSAERERYLIVVLRRAAAFHNAMMAECPPPANLRFSLIGGDCHPTLDGAIILNGAEPRRTDDFPLEPTHVRLATESATEGESVT